MSKTVKVSRVFVWSYVVDASSYTEWSDEYRSSHQMPDQDIIKYEMTMDTPALVELFVTNEGPFEEFCNITIEDTGSETVMDAEEFDELALTLDTPDDAPTLEAIASGKRQFVQNQEDSPAASCECCE